MKKILIVLLSFMLIACSGSKSDKGFLYQVVNNETINNIETNNIESIDISSTNLAVGMNIVDSEQISNLISLFTQISTLEKIEEFDYVDDNYSITFNFENSFPIYCFYDDVVEVIDEEYACYKVENNGGLKKYIEELLTDNFDLNVNYVDLFEYEGLKIQLGKYETATNGNFNIELNTINNSDNDYGIMLKNVKANGIAINTYQELGCMAQNEIGYELPITTSILNNYGIDKIGEVEFQIYVYELDTETHELLDELYQSESFSIKTDDYSMMSKELKLDEAKYEDEDIKVYITTSEEELYTTLNLCVVNDGEENTEVKIDTLNYNDTEITGSQLDLYKCEVNSQDTMVALFPIYNFEYDEENATTTKIDIETLDITLRFETESNVYYSDTISLR